MTAERWAPVPNNPAYEVSDLGRVRNPRTGRILKPWSGSRYLQIHLGKRPSRTIHRLVAEAFLGPCPPGMECRHLDGNKRNNRLENLAWGTALENAADKARHGTRRQGESTNNSKLTEREVLRIRADHAGGRESFGALARRFGVSEATIRRVVKRELWRHV